MIRLFLLIITTAILVPQAHGMNWEPGMKPYPGPGTGPTGDPLVDLRIWYNREKRRVEEERTAERRRREIEERRQAEEALKVQKGIELRALYDEFSRSRDHTLEASEDFIQKSTWIINRYPDYFHIAKGYFANETDDRRMAFKIIFAMVI